MGSTPYGVLCSKIYLSISSIFTYNLGEKSLVKSCLNVIFLFKA